jgi:uncharacterized membrane protein YphA (DoxX/SURF4 family)
MIVKEQKAFPANMLEFGSYDGMKTLVIFILMLALWYFISGIFKIQNWDNSWLVPDALLKTATFMSRSLSDFPTFVKIGFQISVLRLL